MNVTYRWEKFCKDYKNIYIITINISKINDSSRQFGTENFSHFPRIKIFILPFLDGSLQGHGYSFERIDESLNERIRFKE